MHCASKEPGLEEHHRLVLQPSCAKGGAVPEAALKKIQTVFSVLQATLTTNVMPGTCLNWKIQELLSLQCGASFVSLAKICDIKKHSVISKLLILYGLTICEDQMDSNHRAAKSHQYRIY